MDTKLKNNNKIYFTNIIACLILIIMSIGIFNIYPKIKEWAKEESSVPYEKSELLQSIYKSNYVLYKDILNQQSAEEQAGDQIYIQSFNTVPSDAGNIIRNFNNELNFWKDDLNRGLKNLDYLVYINGTSVNKTNTSNELNLLADNTDNGNLKNKYNWCMVIKYDENGVMSIDNVHGADENTIKNTFAGFNIRDFWSYNENENNIKLNPIKNATFIYGIPKDLKYSDRISVIVSESLSHLNKDVLITIVGTILFCILMLVLLVPYKKGKGILGVSFFLKIPLEINCIIFGFGAIFLGFISTGAVLETLKNTLVRHIIGLTVATNVENRIIIAVNIIVWMITIYSILAGAMLLKHIFNTGLVKYLKEKLLVIKIFKSLKKYSNDLIDYVEHIDLTDKSNKVIIKILLINFVILAVISVIWFLGIGAAIIYTIILFVLLRKYVDDMKMKFQILLKATNKIADGNLDVEINEDLGLFNPFKEQVKIIQSGFKNAVSEEIKSQKMKTELISNVSHDLKTPLTSIITYTDLLKNDNISEEERKSYINTIDKKSQRLKFLIEDLFEVSKATSGDIKLNLVNVDIVELMRQTQIELDDKIKDSNLIIKNGYPKNKVILELDSQKTFRIFENLILNIAKYAMKGSRVYIDVIENKENVEVIIKNISAEELNFDPFDIVERFQRGDKSRNTEGSGLGLAIAKSFVEVQGGTFNIEIDGDLFKVIIAFNKLGK